MKFFSLLFYGLIAVTFSTTPLHAKEKEKSMKANSCSEFLNFKLKHISGETKDLCEYQGKVVLVVNTASQCGFTSQYKDLEALYQKYKDKGLVILGFPSNDFGGQEPGSNEEIQSFCQRNYGVSFPLFAKSSVKKGGDNPLFQKLSESSGQAPSWNFGKYLLNRQGQFVEQFSSRVIGEPLAKAVESLL